MADPQWLIDARREGRIIGERWATKFAEGDYREEPPEELASESALLIESTFRASMLSPVWEIPLLTKAEVNQRDWRARSRRSNGAWRAVSKAMGPTLAYLAPFAKAYHEGRVVRPLFTRLGGKKLDRGNLPSALKAVEDAVAFMIGADDGADTWLMNYEQEPGPAYGVRVELRK